MIVPKMLSYLYAFLTLAATPGLKYMLKRRLKVGKEEALRLNERMGKTGHLRPPGALVWFHGASVGESLSALPLIEKMLKERADINIMVTTGTVTSARLMAERLPERAFHQYIPVDQPQWVKSFLDHWRPDAVIWLESDFWPNMLTGLRHRQIPMALVNARMSEKSFRYWNLYGKGFLRVILSGFDLCLTQSEVEKARLDDFGHINIHVTDNLKYAAAPLPSGVEKTAQLRAMAAGRSVWQFVSTHPGEEQIAVEIHKGLKTAIPDILTVIVPRHPARGAEITDLAKTEGLEVAQRSRGEPITAQTDIYLGDTLGELGVFFASFDMTVVGGSFVPHGGHNPIEPAQFGNMVIYGPHMFNFKNISAEFSDAGAALQIGTVEDLTAQLEIFFKHPDAMRQYQQAALELTAKKAGALETLWTEISPWLAVALKRKAEA